MQRKIDKKCDTEYNIKGVADIKVTKDLTEGQNESESSQLVSKQKPAHFLKVTKKVTSN